MLMSSVLRLSMVSLIPLLTELLSSQLQDRHTLPEPQNPRLRRLRLPAQADTPSQRLPGSHSPRQSSCASEVTHLHGGHPSLLVRTGSRVKWLLRTFPKRLGASLSRAG